MSSAGVALLLAMNRLFPLPAHPFNMETDGEMTYARWQFEQGHRTIEYFLRFTTTESMFCGRTVLDVGCGAGGKACYYARQGAEHVWGLDVVPEYREEAQRFSEQVQLAHRTTFITSDAAEMPFGGEAFDTIILNDTIEHLDRPGQALEECLRVLVPGGRIYVSFPPYYHPHGAHLTDAIGIPWVHLMFRQSTLVSAYRQLLRGLPDAERRLRLRLGDDFSRATQLAYVNGMTARGFRGLAASLPARLIHYHEEPLRHFLWPLSRIPILKECFIRMVVAVLEKPAPL